MIVVETRAGTVGGLGIERSSTATPPLDGGVVAAVSSAGSPRRLRCKNRGRGKDPAKVTVGCARPLAATAGSAAAPLMSVSVTAAALASASGALASVERAGTDSSAARAAAAMAARISLGSGPTRRAGRARGRGDAVALGVTALRALGVAVLSAGANTTGPGGNALPGLARTAVGLAGGASGKSELVLVDWVAGGGSISAGCKFGAASLLSGLMCAISVSVGSGSDGSLGSRSNANTRPANTTTPIPIKPKVRILGTRWRRECSVMRG